MLILDIKKYIQEHPRVSVRELTQNFALSAEHIRFILDKWVHKGVVDKSIPEHLCGTNSSCVLEAFELYTWK